MVRDPQAHLLDTVESYVGEGVNFHEMNWALKNSKKTAIDLWEWVNVDQGTSRIHYDNSLDFKDHETMPCAEVAQFTYSRAEKAIIHSSMKSKMAQGTTWTLRHTFLWLILLKLMKLKDFSKEVPRNMLGTVELVTELADGVLKELKLLNDARFVQTGFTPFP